MPRVHLSLATVLVAALLTAGCGESGSGSVKIGASQSCMLCHNGSITDNYSGPGLENPHPFVGAANITCTVCHGGNGAGTDKNGSHVPAPPQIGDRQNWITNRTAYFNRLTLTGIDKYPDYTVNGQTYTALDYLQFINPSDLRITQSGRSCGQCHQAHSDTVANSLLATEAGVLSGAMYAIGANNEVPASVGLHSDTAADKGFRAVSNPGHDPTEMGSVANLLEFPVFSSRNDTSPRAIRNNPAYDAVNLLGDQNLDGTVVSGSELANLYHEQIAFTCGDCHLGSAGANNRYGDFRTSGCAACHMRYSLSGRSTSGDPNLNKLEPIDPDDIDPPELPHVRRHLIQSVAGTNTTGEFVPGIDDYSCAGCHQGSNRTVMQYWGIRLDQNQDVRRGVQYPANPVTFQTTSGDPRLFDPVIGNNTFNGRNRNQYLRFEDYDGDGRDDTPADVHYEAGMGCIDCHGSYDLHGGDVAAGETKILSRMEHATAITCESCHGTVDAYALTTAGTDYDDQPAEVAVDSKGNQLRHVTRDANGDFYMRSRLTGNMHFLPQTRDTIFDNGKQHPLTSDPLFSGMASYAMGRDDGDPSTGIGPRQSGSTLSGFSHSDNMSCVSCHASWTNSCVGCHLEGEYNNGNNFSNITGDRIVFNEEEAQFVYQSPVLFQLGIGPDNQIDSFAANTDMFFRWKDRNNIRSKVFAFSDRNAGGNNTQATPFPALSHNAMMPHSIRGKVTSSNEGPRYCVSCHLTDDALTNYGSDYTLFRTAMNNNDFANLNYGLLQTHIGRNPGNQLNSPMFVHMAAGLGTGLFLFDADGCAVNPLDNDTQRYGCEDVAPANNFDPTRVAFNLDRIVEPDGMSNGSNNHPMMQPGPNLRQGTATPTLSGPLNSALIFRLTDPAGIVLDSWIDADGNPQGNAGNYIP